VQAGEDGVPAAVLRNRTWQSVIEVLDCYRTVDRWWTSEPVSRTYYDLLLDDGRTSTVYQDHIGKAWYEQNYG
jgi:hypothetical protein